MFEQRKDDVFVAPGLHWLIATLEEAAVFGYPRRRPKPLATRRSSTKPSSR